MFFIQWSSLNTTIGAFSSRESPQILPDDRQVIKGKIQLVTNQFLFDCTNYAKSW